VFYYKNKYLGLTIRKLIEVEEETGISSYINTYLSDVVTSDVLGKDSIEKAYNKLNEHLKANYIFPVPSGDFDTAIQCILKSGDIYYVSLTKPSKTIVGILKDNLPRINIKLIILDEIISCIENSDFLEELRKYANRDTALWRKGSPSNISNIILSLKEKGNRYFPIRALKFMIGDKGQIEMEHIITDEGSLEYWQYYFNQDWDAVDNNIRKPIVKLTGAAQIRKAIIEICDNYPDLFVWMREEIEKNKTRSSVVRAIDELKESDRYEKNRCLKMACELCKK